MVSKGAAFLLGGRAAELLKVRDPITPSSFGVLKRVRRSTVGSENGVTGRR
jgi:hypothetical protein